MPKTKKKNKAVWLIMFSFLFVFVMTLIRPGVQKGVTRVSIPDNKGFPKLFTLNNYLIAAESGGGFYLFEWSDIQGNYSKFPSLSQKSVLLFDQDRTISLSWTEGRIIALDKDGAEQFRIANDEDTTAAHLVSNQQQNNVLFIAERQEKNDTYYSIKQVDINNKRLAYVYDLDSDSKQPVELRAFAVSGKDLKVAVAGKKGKHAYIAVVDIDAQKLVWEKTLSDVSDVSSISFSSDGQQLFAGFEEGILSMLNAQNGNLVKTLVLVPQPRKTTNLRTIQSVTTSPQGKWIACVCDPEIFILDQETFSLCKTIAAGHKIVTGLIFSPDEAQLATSDLRASGTIKIIDIETIESK